MENLWLNFCYLRQKNNHHSSNSNLQVKSHVSPFYFSQGHFLVTQLSIYQKTKEHPHVIVLYVLLPPFFLTICTLKGSYVRCVQPFNSLYLR